MFLKNVVFYSVFLQVVFSSENNNSQFYVVSTTQEPSKLFEKPNRINLEIDFDNLIGGKLESILQNQFEYQNKIITNMKNKIEKLNNNITVFKNTKCKNLSENNIQTRWQKFGKKQKKQQLLHDNNSTIYLENSNHDLQKLIEGMLQNQSTQHNILSEMKSKFETTKEEILTLKKHNNQFDHYEKSLETKIDLLISHNNATKAYMENVNNTLAKLMLTLPKTCKEVEEGVNTVSVENVNKKLANITRPKRCIDVQRSGKTLSGVYTIWPDFSSKSFNVWCDMETRGGGWIYVMNRFDGSVNFNLNWTDYKNGFGSLNGQHWLGLEHLYLLTKSKPNELLIELVDQNFTKTYAHYQEFSIGDEGEGYPIKTMKDYSGDAGNYFIDHLGKNFSTADRNTEYNVHGINCARYWGGGFWYHSCVSCVYTGDYRYFNRVGHHGKMKLKKVKMMIH